MSYNPIGRIIKMSSPPQNKEKLNHVPLANIYPLQLTGQAMKTFLQSNPQGTIPAQRKWRSITLDIIGKVKEVRRERTADAIKERRQIDKHLLKPFEYAEKIYSKPKKGSQDMSRTLYQHTEDWNKSVIIESKRKSEQLTKDQIINKLYSSSKQDRDKILLKEQNKQRIIEQFYLKLKKAVKSKYFLQQYGESFEEYEGAELLRKLFASFARSNGISLISRSDQHYVLKEELIQFCFSIGFKERHLSYIEEFYEAIFNPSLSQDIKIPLQKNAQMIPGSAFVRKVNSISMRAVIYNYARFLRENFEIKEKFSNLAVKNLLVQLYSNILPWIHYKRQLKANLESTQKLEQEYLINDNFNNMDEKCFEKINQMIQERDEQIEEKIIICKLLYKIIKQHSQITIEILRKYFINYVVNKASKIAYLEDFLKGLFEYFQNQMNLEHLQEEDEEEDNSNQYDIYKSGANSVSLNAGSLKESKDVETNLRWDQIVDFIDQEQYDRPQCEFILQMLAIIKSDYNSQQSNKYLNKIDIINFTNDYKQRQDLKQSILQQFIEKCKDFLDKNMLSGLNISNNDKLERNAIVKYALQKVNKYDQIIANRAIKLKDILELIQKRMVFRFDPMGCTGSPPILDQDQLELEILKILQLDKVDVKLLKKLFDQEFTHDYLEDQIQYRKKIQLKKKTWDSEINQALTLYQQESLRLINSLQQWTPPLNAPLQSQQSRRTSFTEKKQKKKKSSIVPPIDMNKANIQSFIENDFNKTYSQKQYMKESDSRRGSNSRQLKPTPSMRTSQQAGTNSGSRRDIQPGSSRNIPLSASSRIIPQLSSRRGTLDQNKVPSKASQYLEEARKMIQNSNILNQPIIGEGDESFLDQMEKEITQMQAPLQTLQEENENPIKPEDLYLYKTDKMYEDLILLINGQSQVILIMVFILYFCKSIKEENEIA